MRSALEELVYVVTATEGGKEGGREGGCESSPIGKVLFTYAVFV